MRVFNSDEAHFRIRVRFINLTAFLSITFLCLFFGITSAVAQNYTTMIGTPNFSTDIPVRLGYVNAANGDLHIEIPLGTYAQRANSHIPLDSFTTAVSGRAQTYGNPTTCQTKPLATSGAVGGC